MSSNNEFDLISSGVGPLLEHAYSDRGKLGEYLVAVELLNQGWEVFAPLQDSYVDFIIRKGEEYKTIQIKASKLIIKKRSRYFRVNHRPKDILHDPRHFFVWFFPDQETNKAIYVIIRPEEFSNYVNTDKRHGFTKQTWRVNKSRESIYENDLMYGGQLSSFVNSWSRLDASLVDSNLVGVQETNDDWKNDSIFKSKFTSNIQILKNQLSIIPPEFKDVIDEKTKIRKRLFDERIDEVNVDTSQLNPSRPESKEFLMKGISYTACDINGYNLFQNIEDKSKFVKIKIICKDCGEMWESNEKECFLCKIWRPPLKVCNVSTCRTLNKIEAKKCRKCKTPLGTARCIGCNEEKNDDNTVPLTHCIKCGNRTNKFEILNL